MAKVISMCSIAWHKKKNIYIFLVQPPKYIKYMFDTLVCMMNQNRLELLLLDASTWFEMSTQFHNTLWNSSRVLLQSDLFKNIKWLAIYEWYILRRNQNNTSPLFVCQRPTQGVWLNVKQTNAPLSCLALPFNMNTHITHFRETIKMVERERERERERDFFDF